jgi:hypothetical protein
MPSVNSPVGLKKNALGLWSVPTAQKLVLMFFFAGITFGATGLGAMLLMTLLANTNLGKDESAKHGISLSESSRLSISRAFH